MNRPRDPKGRYIKYKSDLSTKVPYDLFGRRNIPLINLQTDTEKHELAQPKELKQSLKRLRQGAL
jgi:hypothetical protein